MLPVTPALLLSRTTEFCTQETCLQARKTWSFSKIRGIVSGVLTVFGGLCWGPPILGNYQEKGRLWTSGQVLFLEGLQAPIILSFNWAVVLRIGLARMVPLVLLQVSEAAHTSFEVAACHKSLRAFGLVSSDPTYLFNSRLKEFLGNGWFWISPLLR